MKNRKDPLGLSATRIEMIKASDAPLADQATNLFMSRIQNARERMEEIAAKLDDHLGFAPDEVTFDAAGIAQGLLNKLDDALTIAEKAEDLNQALHQADKDNPARG